LWASTGTKNKAYSDVLYVEPLIGRDTVNTMPLATLQAFNDHGKVEADTVIKDVDQARAQLARLSQVGIDLAQVCAELTEQGQDPARLARRDEVRQGPRRRARDLREGGRAEVPALRPLGHGRLLARAGGVRARPRQAGRGTRPARPRLDGAGRRAGGHPRIRAAQDTLPGELEERHHHRGGRLLSVLPGAGERRGELRRHHRSGNAAAEARRAGPILA